jgi:PIN domain nuclease of toxin-antitoxin system
MLERKGRLKFSGDLLSALGESIMQFQEAPLTHEIAALAERLPLAHRDPADRFLAATAKVHGMALATHDKHLLNLIEISTLSNR